MKLIIRIFLGNIINNKVNGDKRMSECNYCSRKVFSIETALLDKIDARTFK